MAITVVGSALLRVREYAVGLRDLLELFGGFFVIAGIAVRVILQRQLAVGALDLLVGSVSPDAQHFVIVSLMIQTTPSLKVPAAPVARSIFFAGRLFAVLRARILLPRPHSHLHKRRPQQTLP